MAHVEQAARATGTLTPPTPSLRKPARKEREEQKERVRRFLALPPALQEGVLRYGENIQKAYSP